MEFIIFKLILSFISGFTVGSVICYSIGFVATIGHWENSYYRKPLFWYTIASMVFVGIRIYLG